jgi:predicted HicB family RNase H-like nuclease
MNTKEYEVYRKADEMYRRNPDWVTFFRQILGVDGVMRTAYPEPAQLAAFEQTTEYMAIQQMLAKLRERSNVLPQPQEPTRVITVRLPQSLHDSLRVEAHEHQTSVNKLCISKLLQMVDAELVPADGVGAK